MPRIVIATQNPGKVREIATMLAPLDIEGVALDDAGGPFDEPEEHGSTFLENATIKAKAYARTAGMLCLADDSGLVVDALDGRPGVISSHYAFDGETGGDAAMLTRQQRDAKNIDRVLDELDPIEPEARTARFVCAMVLASASGAVLARSEGTFEGRIGVPPGHPHATPADAVPRGANGFGYDPIFLVAPDFIRTSAELDPEAKNKLSHRAEALGAMVRQIRALGPDPTDRGAPDFQ